MYVEFQLSSAAFTRIVRNRFKAVPLCVDRELTGPNGEQLVIDRVAVGENTWIQREQAIDLVNGLPVSRDIATQILWVLSPHGYPSWTVPFLQVKQEITITLVTSADLDANGRNPSPPARTLSIYPVYNVALTPANQTQGGGPVTLSYTLAHIDFGVLYLTLSDQQRADLTAQLATMKLPPTTLDLSPLSAVLKRPVSAINAGIACDPAGTRVALRIDFEIYQTNPHVGPELFVAGPADLLNGRDWAMLVDADLIVGDATTRMKAALESAPKVRLDSGPTVTWQPTTPGLAIAADVELVDACPFFIDDIDMDAHVEVGVSLSVPAPNDLRTHFHIEGSPSNPLEEIACAVTGALLWPFIGPVMLKDEELGAGIGYYLGGMLLLPIVRFFAIIFAIETKSLSADLSSKLGDSCHKIDDENYECDEMLDIRLALGGPRRARLVAEQVSGRSEGLVLSGTIDGFGDPPAGSVSVTTDPFRWQIVGRCRGNGGNNFRVANQATIAVNAVPPAVFCGARLLPGSVGSYTLTTANDTVTITPTFTPGTVIDPPPCRVRVITSHGVRTIRFGPPKRMADGEQERLETARLRAIASCYFWDKFHTPVEKIRWRPDPPADREHILQLWQIVARGIREGEAVEVLDGADRPLVRAFPSAAGLVHVSVRLAGADAQPELTLRLRTDRPLDQPEDQWPELAVQQLQYEPLTSITTRGELALLRFETGAGQRRLVVVDAEDETVFDLGSGVTPTLISSLAAQPRDRGTAMTSRGKDVVPFDRARFGTALDQLIHQLGPIEAIGSPKVGGIRQPLYVRSGGTARIFDVSEPEQPRPVQTFTGPAWFEGLATGPGLLALHSAEQNRLDVYTLTADWHLGTDTTDGGDE